MSSPLPSSAFQVRGHDAAIERLRSLLEGEPPHALLLVGPAGVGLGTLARDVAAALLCAAPTNGGACRSCRSCRLVEHASHADLHLLAPEGPAEIGVDAARALAGAMLLLPVEGARRVALILHADRLSEPAQHALLKLLEEPPPHTHLLLAASDDAVLLPTVRSRCATLRLGLPDHEAATTLLVERLGVDASTATRLLAIGEGRPGPLLRAGATKETADAHATLRGELLALLATTPLARLPLLPPLVTRASSLLSIEAAVLEEGAGRAKGSGAERRAAAGTLLRLYRSLVRDLAAVAVGAAAAISFPDELPALQAMQRRLPAGGATVALERLDRAVGALRANPNPELLLDATLLSLPVAR